MKFRYFLGSCLLTLCAAAPGYGQVGCEYFLELYDSFGDGWNGGFLTVTIDGKSENYGFTDGYTTEYTLLVSDGDSLSIGFTAGFFAFEASFRLLDSDGSELYFSGDDPSEGILLETSVSCPVCPRLLSTGVSIEEIRHNRAVVRWVQNDPNGTYLLKIGPTGADPEALSAVPLVGVDRYTLSGLEERTSYDVYLQAICSTGDTSDQIGPFGFETLWTRDVGISALVEPVSDCGLPADGRISVLLKNFGGAPQTLIPFNYSVNGVAGAVNQPIDGFFTGILSFDSTYLATFDATFDFSEPIPYEIMVWTELEGDNNPANDTFRTTIVHTPLITAFPYEMGFETGSGGWMVDPQTSMASSLQLGRPQGSVITTAATGSRAWVTNLNGNYNNNERSVLLSPCFDFTQLEKDPELSFALWVSSEPTFDGVWVELSIGGGPWNKLGVKDGSGAFWYNTTDNIYGDWWSGDNLFGGWRKVRYPLTGLAGEPDVRLRFVFQSDEAVVREGIGIDDIFIAPILAYNLNALEVSTGGQSDCGDAGTEVTLTLRNDGTESQQGFNVAYQVNDGDIVTEVFTPVLSPNSTTSYTFDNTFDTTVPDEYVIRAWIAAAGEEFAANDTTTLVYTTAGPGLPFLENFETGVLPEGWTLDEDLIVDNSHNSGSQVLFDNLWEDDTVFRAVTPLLGPIAATDSLLFSYRFVNFMGFGTQPTVLGAGDALRVEVSLDCGESFQQLYEINAGNHQLRNTLTRVRLSLGAYEGQWIKIRFRGSWGGGDYYVDLDNINVRRCPPDLGLQATVNQPTGSNSDGSIRLTGAGGIMPYRYFWNNGNRNASASGLAPGTYTITVTDQQGCTDNISVVLESVVASAEPVPLINTVRLFPNPNDGQSRLTISLAESLPVGIFIFDARGRRLRQYQYRESREINQLIELNDYPDGMYFIRIVAGRSTETLRMVKANAP